VPVAIFAVTPNIQACLAKFSQAGLKFSRLLPITGITAVDEPGSKRPATVNGDKPELTSS
jgi:hypothetical protein